MSTEASDCTLTSCEWETFMTQRSHTTNTHTNTARHACPDEWKGRQRGYQRKQATAL